MQQLPRDHWRSRIGFILAATGSAVGLGNLWKFPYITWHNHGGAFVIIYLISVVIIGWPIMMAEILIGRKTQGLRISAASLIHYRSSYVPGTPFIFTGYL